MNRPTAVALTGCLIVLFAYIVVTSASLVRELKLTNVPPAAQNETIAGTPVQLSGPASNDNKLDVREAQARSARRHRLRTVSHHSKTRTRQEPVTLFL